MIARSAAGSSSAWWLLVTAWLLGPGLVGCADLPTIAPQGCGNRVVDDGEDCDEPPGATAFDCAQPGEAHACRFRCDPAVTKPACPAGHACGSDGLCRIPTGTFVSVGRPIEAASTSLQTGDFDGDRSADLLALGPGDYLGRGSGQVVFFSDATRQNTRQRLPGLLGTPATGRFSDSPYAGLVLADATGIVTLIGRRDRQFFPRAYPTIPLDDTPGTGDVTEAAVYALPLLATRAVTSLAKDSPQVERLIHQNDERALFFTVTSPAKDAVFHYFAVIDDEKQGLPVALQKLPHGPDELLGEPVVVSLSPSAPCPTVLLGFTSERTALYAFQPCLLDADGHPALADAGQDFSKALPQRKLQLLPWFGSPAELDGLPWVVDVNGDQRPDVLVPVRVTIDDVSLSISYVGYGDEDGGLSWTDPQLAEPPGAQKNTLGPYYVPGAWIGPSSSVSACGLSFQRPSTEGLLDSAVLLGPLAAADLDGDGQVDLVNSSGVCTSRDQVTPGGGVSYRLASRSDGDQLLEARLVDLDGNGQLDVVGLPSLGSALLAFLDVGGSLFTRINVPLDGLARQLRPGDFDGDGVGDVAFIEGSVQSQSNGTGSGDALSVLFGSHDQAASSVVRVGRFDAIDRIAAGRPTSPNISDLGLAIRNLSTDAPARLALSLLSGSPDRALRAPLVLDLQALTVAVAAGRFRADTPATQQDIAALTVQGEDFATLRLWVVPLQQDAQLRGDTLAGESLPNNASPTLQGLRNLGRIVAGDLDGDSFDELLLLDSSAASPDAPAQARLRVAHPATSDPPLALSDARAVGLSLDDASAVLVADADGDGRRDALVTGQDASGQTRLAVLLTQADGTFAEPRLLTAPSGLLTGPLCVQRRSGRDIVLALGDGATWRLTPTASGLTLTATPGLQNQGGSALACDDFDGDGVDDVALSSGSLIQAFRGLPQRP